MAAIVASCGNSINHIIGVWVEVAGKVVPISQDEKQPTELAPGTYQLEWDYRANPGAAATIELYRRKSDGKWIKYKPPLEITMPAGQTIVTSEDGPPDGYVPYRFTIKP